MELTIMAKGTNQQKAVRKKAVKNKKQVKTGV